MAYLGFTTELKRQGKLAGLTKQIRNTFNKAVEDGNTQLNQQSEQAMKQANDAVLAYSDKYGLPGKNATETEKEQFANYMAEVNGAVDNHLLGVAKAESDILASKQEYVENVLQRYGRMHKNFSPDEISGVVNDSWGTGEMHAGVVDVFNKTADARATALGVTRFRGTDGAMSTLGSIGSLFYKDNDHLSGKGIAAIGGTAGVSAIAAASMLSDD